MIRSLTPEDIPALKQFLDEIQSEPFFHAKIDPIEACTSPGKDVYCAAFVNGSIVALGFLRGRNSGFAHFSLGIVVSPRHRNQGIGRFMMAMLHALAKMHGETKIRLRVHPDNKVARTMYEKYDYIFTGEIDRDEFVGWKEL